MKVMKRGVGYCENTDCEDYAKGVFLLNHGDTFYCPRCRQLGRVERERGFHSGEAPFFSEVRVEFDFVLPSGKFVSTAIVRDESLPGGSVYTLRSPLIKTDKRALSVATALLGNLNLFGVNQGSNPSTALTVISLDEDLGKLKEKLARLAGRLEGSWLTQKEAT